MSITEKLGNSIKKELESIARTEAKMKKKANLPTSSYKDKIESKIPRKINLTLQSSFVKAFGIVFEKGIGIIEKGYDKGEIAADYDIQNYTIDKKGSRKELKKLKKTTQKSDLLNMSVTAVEGLGLGALGIGLPDIVIFIGMILKGIYEVSLRYGYDYNSIQEKYFILIMMKAALSKGKEWNSYNAEVDRMISSFYAVSEDIVKDEIEKTAKAFATDMLVLKFIQGIPIVGVIGGIFNPIYYNKITNYVKLKYHKRYLLNKLNER